MIRKFKLWNSQQTSSFSLYDRGIVLVDPTGLGNKFDLVKSEGSDKYYISDSYPNFEDISFKLYFGVDANAYQTYNSLMTFIANNGKNKLVLEYDVNDTVKYCDVWLKDAPKTEKDITGTMNSTFKFERLSYWYSRASITFSLETEYREVQFPLDIPIPFVGTINRGDQELINDFFDNYFLDITVQGPLNHNLEVYLKNSNGVKIQQVFITKTLASTDLFYVNAETKKVIYYDGYSVLEENGYNYLDHTYDSFIVVPNGRYSIGVGLLSGDECYITISYRKLVLD